MKRKIILSIIALATAVCGFTVALPTYAADTSNSCAGVDTILIDCDDSENGIEYLLEDIIDIFMAVVGVLAVIGIGIVGTQYLTAGGNEEQVRKAKRRLFEIVIGLGVFVLAYAFLKFLLPGFNR